MSRCIRMTAAALLVLSASAGMPAGAQETTGGTGGAIWPFKSPVFVLQPGAVTTNFLDTPAGAESSTEFNFRVVTAIPTTIPRTAIVAIVQFTPLAKTAGFTANAPGFVYGPVINIVNTPVLSFDFDVLGAYGPAARETDESSYTHKLVLEGDLFLKIGQMMSTSPQSHWRNLSLYALLANVATGLPDEASPWVLLTGLSLPIAP